MPKPGAKSPDDGFTGEMLEPFPLFKRARHRSLCPVCGGVILRGDRIRWVRGRPAWHQGCDPLRVALEGMRA